MVAQMKPDQRQKYVDLKRQSEGLSAELEKLQEELAGVNLKRKQLEDEVSLSQIKLEAVSLYTKLREATEKKDALLEEEATKGTPAQERERLLKQVKLDNAQLAGEQDAQTKRGCTDHNPSGKISNGTEPAFETRDERLSVVDTSSGARTRVASPHVVRTTERTSPPFATANTCLSRFARCFQVQRFCQRLQTNNCCND